MPCKEGKREREREREREKDTRAHKGTDTVPQSPSLSVILVNELEQSGKKRWQNRADVAMTESQATKNKKQKQKQKTKKKGIKHVGK